MRIVSLPRLHWSVLVLAATAIILHPMAHSQSNNNNKTQQVTLVDPTPRPIDPHLLFGDNSQAGTATQEAAEHRNQKRRELTVWAAGELVTLSHHLETDVSKPNASLNPADATANAEKIEQLAKNLASALKAP